MASPPPLLIPASCLSSLSLSAPARWLALPLSHPCYIPEQRIICLVTAPRPHLGHVGYWCECRSLDKRHAKTMANDYASIHAHYSATYRYLEICQRKLTAPQPLLDSRGRNRQGSQSTYPSRVHPLRTLQLSEPLIHGDPLGSFCLGFSFIFPFSFSPVARLLSQIPPRGLSEGFTRSAGLESPIARLPTR